MAKDYYFDQSWMHRGWVGEFNLGELTRIIELTSNRHSCPHNALMVVDVKVTDRIGDLEEVNEYILDTIQLDSLVNKTEEEEMAFAG